MPTTRTSTATISMNTDPSSTLRWQTVLFRSAIILLCILAIGMRLYNLNAAIERDYDEGVYWQSLHAMSAGHPLYSDIFYSQPPFFLISLYPIFALFGGSLWAARLGIALISLFGVLGALLLGKALCGRVGAIVALLLIIVNPMYLSESRVLQADAPGMAFALLAVGLAFLWWEQPDSVSGLCWITLATISLALALLSKLFVAGVIPIALLMLMRLWQILRKKPGTSRRSLLPLLVSSSAGIITLLLILAPFLGSFQSLIQEAVIYHTKAATVFAATKVGNFVSVPHALISLLGLAALYGTVVAIVRMDVRAIPLVGWLLATIIALLEQVPLLAHHFISLYPPLIALAILGLSNVPIHSFAKKYQSWLPRALTAVALVLILSTIIAATMQDYQYYAAEAASHDYQLGIAADLRQSITPDQEVVTDEQFIAAIADRGTPPGLVDASTVRIGSGFLTLQQLIAISSQPQVHAVLFLRNRFLGKSLLAYHAWVAQHFHLKHDYGNNMELWVR